MPFWEAPQRFDSELAHLADAWVLPVL